VSFYSLFPSFFFVVLCLICFGEFVWVMVDFVFSGGFWVMTGVYFVDYYF
jgi:hypothetical protein